MMFAPDVFASIVRAGTKPPPIESEEPSKVHEVAGSSQVIVPRWSSSLQVMPPSTIVTPLMTRTPYSLQSTACAHSGAERRSNCLCSASAARAHARKGAEDSDEHEDDSRRHMTTTRIRHRVRSFAELSKPAVGICPAATKPCAINEMPNHHNSATAMQLDSTESEELRLACAHLGPWLRRVRYDVCGRAKRSSSQFEVDPLSWRGIAALTDPHCALA